MYETKYIRGPISPAEFSKFDKGATIYYEVNQPHKLSITRAQQFISGQSNANQIKVKQAKIYTLDPDTLEPQILIKVKIVGKTT